MGPSHWNNVVPCAGVVVTDPEDIGFVLNVHAGAFHGNPEAEGGLIGLQFFAQ